MVLRKTVADPLTKRFVEEYINIGHVNSQLHDQIADYVTGETDVCPPIEANQRFYGYSVMTQLDRLKKSGDERAFFRAAELVYRASHRFYEKQDVMEKCFWDAIKLRKLNDTSARRTSKEEEAFEAMKKTVEHFGLPIFSEFMVKAAEDYRASINRDYNSVFERANHLLLIAYAYEISPTLLEEAKQKLEPIYYHLVTGDEKAYINQLWNLAKNITMLQLNSNHSVTIEVLPPAFLKEKRAQIRETYFPDEIVNEGSVLNDKHKKRYMEMILSLVYYRVHVAGGIEAFLAQSDKKDRELLSVLTILMELFPLDVLAQDVQLAELVKSDEPYLLLLQLRNHLTSAPVSWRELNELTVENIDKTRRAFELTTLPIIKGYLFKIMQAEGIDLSDQEHSLETIILDSLRRLKGTTKLASFLQGTCTLEEVLGSSHLEDMQRVGRQMYLLSFLPSEHPFIQRLLQFFSNYVDKSSRKVGLFCFAHAFQDQLGSLVDFYRSDEDIDLPKLVVQILESKGSYYYYTQVNEENYGTLIKKCPEICLASFGQFDTEVRMFVLETMLAQKDSLPLDLRNQAILLGMGDTSKKVSAIANAEFLLQKDKELYVHVYTTEKKAKVKELALDAIRGLEDSKEIFQELLAKEKNNKFKTLLQAFVDSEESGPDASLSNLGNLVDKRKLVRIKWLPLDLLPALCDMEGNELGREVMEYILTSSIEAQTAPNPRVLELKEHLSAASLADFTAEVLRTWLDNGAVAKEKWVMPLCISLGDRHSVDTIGQMIKDWTDHSRGALASDGVRALSFSDDLAALRIIDHTKRSIKNKQVKNAAEEALNMAATNQNISTEELEDRLVTQLGFDASGKQVFDYGDRTFTVKVNNELELEVINDSTGKAVKNLPAPSAKDDQQKAEEARATFALLKKDLKNLVKIQSLRLEEFLSKARFWSTAAWKQLFVENVLMQKFAIGLVWGVYQDGKLVDTFRYMDDGTFNTVDEDEYELADGQLIGLIHPLELESDTLAGWRTQLEDYEITQPFDQLNREAFLPTEEELKVHAILRLPQDSYTPTTFAKTMEKFGWTKGIPQDAGFYYEFHKVYGDIVAELKISGASISYYDGMEDIQLEELAFYSAKDNQYRYHYYQPTERIKLTEIPARVFSETVYDVTRAAGK